MEKRKEYLMAERRFPGKRSKEKAEKVELEAYRFCGYPSEDTQKILMRNINGCRGFWNILVSDGEEHYRKTGKRMRRTPAGYKKEAGYEWLSELDSLALSNVQLDYEKAMDAFLSDDAGHPKRKKKGRCRASYTTNLSNGKKKNLFLEEDMLKLPKVKTRIRLNIHRPVRSGGLLKKCTVCKEADRWMFALVFEYPKVQADNKTEKDDAGDISHIGLDMSLPKLYVDSNGEEPDHLKPYREMEKRLAFEQRKLSRKIRANTDHYEVRDGKRYPVYRKPLAECRNIQKQIKKVNALYARTKHIREDILHKLSAELTDRYELISIEDLNIAVMKQSLKFGKTLSDNGWGAFTRMLKYKQEKKGHELIRVDKWFPSSKTCLRCGHIHKELKLRDREYVCPVCGHTMDRDHQAAVNIDQEGLRIYKEKYCA